MPTEKSLLERVAEEVTKLGHLISGNPYDPNDIGMKGTVLKVSEELENFDASEFKANTEFRKRKESEMSRIMVGVIILLINILATSVVSTIILTKGTP
ncbi:hypothetical protein KAR91_29350 [Candidatus Pacearchaeota archaeon]|nr:hypothetical protein [Candidatus Pacearchaeota archaeon]